MITGAVLLAAVTIDAATRLRRWYGARRARQPWAPRRAALIGFGLADVPCAPTEVAPGLRLATIVTSSEERAPGQGGVPRRRCARQRRSALAAGIRARADRGRHPQQLARPARWPEPSSSASQWSWTSRLRTSADAARALVTEAERRGVLLTVFQNCWDSDQMTLRRLLAEGALGRVHRYESRFERWRPQLREGAPGGETTAPAEGGGVLLDLGSHLADQALTLARPGGRGIWRGGVHLRRRQRRRRLHRDHASRRRSQPPLGVLGRSRAGSAAESARQRGRVRGHTDGQEDALAEGLRPPATRSRGASSHR